MLNFKDMSDDHLRSIKTQTLIMVSDRDVVTATHAVKISQLITGSRLVILPGLHGGFIGAAEGTVERRESKKGVSLPEITASLVEDFLQD